MALRQRRPAQLPDKLLLRQLREIRHRKTLLILVLHTPDPSPLLVPLRMIPRHFIVTDDLVIPVHNVHTTVRPHRHRHRPEPLVARLHKIRQPFHLPTRPRLRAAVHLDGLNLPDNRIRHQHHITPFRRIRPARIRQRQPAQPSPAHPEIRTARKLRRITLPLSVRASGIIPVIVKRHHRITKVIRLLDEGLPLAVHHEAPDVARAVARDLKLRTIRPEPRHPRLVKLHFLVRPVHFPGIERPLRQPDPPARRTRELVRKQMRILHPEPRQHHLPLVRLAIPIRVPQQLDVVPVLHITPVLVRQNPQRNRQSLREHRRLLRKLRRTPVRPTVHNVVHQNLVLRLARIQRIRRRRILIRIHRILQRRHRPQPPLLVKIRRNELPEPLRLILTNHQLHLKPRRQRERRLLFLRRHRRWLRRRLRIRRSLRLHRRRQFLNRDLLRLNESLPAPVHLNPNQPLPLNRRIRLDIIHPHHPVDPRRHPRPLCPNHILVPVIPPDHRIQRLHVTLRHHPVPPTLIIHTPPPRRIPVITLITPHLRRIRHPRAPHLNPAVHKPRPPQPQLRPQHKIPIPLLRRQKIIVLHLLRQRPARNRPVRHLPQLRIPLPAIQRLPVKQRHRILPGHRRRLRSQHRQTQNNKQKQAGDLHGI